MNLTSDIARVGRRLLGSRQMNHLVRFEPVLELIGDAPSDGLTLLDVGSGSVGIGSMLPDAWRVTSVDADFEDYGAVPAGGRDWTGRVIGDVRSLPFADRAFDIVVAVDLLEHVPPEGRVQAVREICRVARSRAVVACPAGDEALCADRRLAMRIQSGGRAVPPWLAEHLEHGFPQVSQITAAAGPFGAARPLANENVTAHERLVAAELFAPTAVVLRLLCRPLESMLVSDRARARQLARLTLRALRGWDRPPVYRTVVAIDIRVPGPAQVERHNRE